MKKIIAAALLACSVGASFAGADPESLSVLNALKGKYPNTQFTNIDRSPINGLYEVTIGKNIAYTDASGRYLLFGSVYDMQTNTDLTAAKREAANRIDYKGLPFKDAITIVKGKGERQIAVFTDPDCPYCKRLEGELAKVDNVTIHVFLFPIAELHPDAKNKSESVWCASDRPGAWGKLMLEGKVPASKPCDNPVERNVTLAGNLGIRGTPFLIAADGRTLPGAAPADRINAWLNGAK